MNGVRQGQGKFFYKSGGMFIGGWHDGKMSGQGVLFYPNGAKAYEGEWRGGKFHGRGTLLNDFSAPIVEAKYYLNFDIAHDAWEKYEGEFKSDLKDGVGCLWFSDGSRFEGSFSNDKADGQGKFYEAQGECIEGIWMENRLTHILKPF